MPDENKCEDIVLCRHKHCREKELSISEWKQLADWLPMITGQGNLLSDMASEYLYKISKNKDKTSVWYVVRHFKQFDTQKDIWFTHRFRGDFEIWREDHTVYQLSNGSYLVHK